MSYENFDSQQTPRYLEIINSFRNMHTKSIPHRKRAVIKNKMTAADLPVSDSASSFSIQPKHFISSGTRNLALFGQDTTSTANFASPLEQYQRVSEIRKQQGLPPMNADEKRLMMLQLKYQQQGELENRKSQLRQGEGLRQDVFKVMRATLPIFYGK
jgi:hypothetical protein